MAFLQRRKGYDLKKMCLAFIGYEGSEGHVKAQRQRGRPDRLPPRRPVHRQRPGRALRPEEVRHALHPRLPARPRASSPTCPRPRRRGAGSARSTRTRRPPRAARSPGSACRGYVMCHLSHSYHSGACLYFTFALVPGAGQVPIEAYDEVKAADPAGVRRRGRDPLAPPRGGDGARALAGAGHLRPGRRRCCGRCSTASTRAPTSTRARSRALPTADAERNHGSVHLEEPSRRVVAEPVTRPQTPRARARRGRDAGSRRPRHGRDRRPSARPRSALRAADLVRRGRARGGAARGPAAAGALAARRRRGSRPRAPCDPRHAAPAPGCTCGIHALHPRRSAARHVLGYRGRVVGRGRGGRRGGGPPRRLPRRARPAVRVLRHAAGERGADRPAGGGLPRRGRAGGRRRRGRRLVPRARPRARRRRGRRAARPRGPRGGPPRAARAPGSGSPASAVAIAVMLFLGLEFTANPGDRPLFGRTGPVTRARRSGAAAQRRTAAIGGASDVARAGTSNVRGARGDGRRSDPYVRQFQASAERVDQYASGSSASSSSPPSHATSRAARLDSSCVDRRGAAEHDRRPRLGQRRREGERVGRRAPLPRRGDAAPAARRGR